MASYDHFLQLFQCEFVHSPKSKEIGELLFTLKQRTQSAAESALNFWEAGSGWNEPDLKATYGQGLNTDLLTELACHDDQLSLDMLIDKSICLGTFLHNQGAKKMNVSPMPDPQTIKPMQLG